MIRALALSAAFALGLTTVALAVEAPANLEQCHKLLDEVSEGADPTKLGDDTLKKLDDLMNTAEGQCDKGQFAEVVQTADAIKSVLAQPQKN